MSGRLRLRRVRLRCVCVASSPGWRASRPASALAIRSSAAAREQPRRSGREGSRGARADSTSQSASPSGPAGRAPRGATPTCRASEPASSPRNGRQLRAAPAPRSRTARSPFAPARKPSASRTCARSRSAGLARCPARPLRPPSARHRPATRASRLRRSRPPTTTPAATTAATFAATPPSAIAEAPAPAPPVVAPTAARPPAPRRCRCALRPAPVRDRQRQRHEDERLQRPPLRALALREAVAIRAGAQVRAQCPPLAQREPSVELAVDRERRLLAADLLLELLSQRAARAEEERLERGDADAEHAGDLGVRRAFELAHDERRALVRRQLRERAPQILGGRRPRARPPRRRRSRSSNATSRGRRCAWRKRCRQTLCAIAISQLCGLSGRVPLLYARYALRNVVCVTSSASAASPSIPSAYR